MEELQEHFRALRYIEVRPVEVMKLFDLPLQPADRVGEQQVPDDVVSHVLHTGVGHLQFQALPDLPEDHGVANLHRPILPGLGPVVLHTVAEHHDDGAAVLEHHQPEVVHSGGERTLGQDVIPSSLRTLHQVSVDVDFFVLVSY